VSDLLLFLPVIGAPILHGPVLALDLLEPLKRPLDGGARWRGKRLFGDNKTWRGALVMTLGPLLATVVLWQLDPWRDALPAAVVERPSAGRPLGEAADLLVVADRLGDGEPVEVAPRGQAQLVAVQADEHHHVAVEEPRVRLARRDEVRRCGAPQPAGHAAGQARHAQRVTCLEGGRVDASAAAHDRRVRGVALGQVVGGGWWHGPAKDRGSVGYCVVMSSLGAILTAIVTPFDATGAVDEQAFVDLMHHLAGKGSDGFVVCGTTGEAATLDDDEHLRVIELAVQERPAGKTVVAGVGSNDTRHAVHLTRRACELGADALLSVNPYYNRPNRRGIIAHYREVVAAADRPIILYNIPQRTGSDMPNDLLAELAQLDHISAVKQANNDNLAMIDGLDLYAGNDDILAATLDLGGAGGILVASHVVGPEMRRMVDEPSERIAIHQDLLPVFEALSVAPAAISTKAALNLMGINAGHTRLPYVDADEHETAVIRAMLEARGLVGATA